GPSRGRARSPPEAGRAGRPARTLERCHPMTRTTSPIGRSAAAILVGLALIIGACSASETSDGGVPSDGGGNVDENPGDCVVVDLSVSSEKIDLLTELARDFNGSDDAEVDGECIFARVQSKASGGAAQLL